MQQDTKKSLFQSASRFFSGTLLSRITGMLRDITMAFAFGTEDAVAAFFVAFRFAHLFRRLFGEGLLSSVFTPQFEDLRSENPEKAYRFFKNSSSGLITILLFVIICMMTVSAGVWHIFPLQEGTKNILVLTCLMAPSLLFICLFGLNAALLQCEQHFFIPSVAPVAFNGIWIAGTLIVWKLQPHAPMVWLSGIVILACCGQWLMTLPKTLHILQQHHMKKFSYSLFFSKRVFILKTPFLLGMLGMASTQVNNALDVVFARYAANEGPALLWYAIRIQQLPLALFGIALSGALLPPLSRALKAKNLSLYQSFLKYSVKQCLWIMIPMTIGLLLFGKYPVKWIYFRGNFSHESIIGTVDCLRAYSLGLLPMSLVLILAPSYYSQKSYKIPAAASVICVLFNVSLNALLVMGFECGPASVALATSISAWINAILLWKLKRLERTSKLLRLSV